MPYDLFAGTAERPAPEKTIERLFFGLMLPEPQAEAASDVLRRSRGDHDLRGSPIRLDRLHVTLIHVGDYPSTLPPDVVTAMLTAGGSLDEPSFDVVFDRASSFTGKPNRYPHVLLGGAGVEALADFRSRLMKAVVRGGVRPVSRQTFNPHVTLAYADRRLPERSIHPVSWRPEEFVLIHSEVGRSIYHTLGRWPLR